MFFSIFQFKSAQKTKYVFVLWTIKENTGTKKKSE